MKEGKTVVRPAEFARVTAGSFVWHRYDPEVKADLFATALQTADGVLLVDPFAVAAPSLAQALGKNSVLGVVVTNANHGRGSPWLGRDQ